MKIQYIGDGTPAPQVLSFPGGKMRKWQSMTVAKIPPWVETAPARSFLVDGQVYPGLTKSRPEKPIPDPANKE